jgi:hypothetical protein
MPLYAGGVNATDAEPIPGVATRPVGGSGAVRTQLSPFGSLLSAEKVIRTFQNLSVVDVLVTQAIPTL